MSKEKKVVEKKNTKKNTKKIQAKFISMSSEFAPKEIKIKYIDNYVHFGDDNQYPYYLQDLLRTSGLHRSIIERKVRTILGTNVFHEDNEDMDLFIPNQYETLEELLTKCVYDQEIYGSYYLQIFWKRNGSGIAEIYHMPYERMRVGLPIEFGYVTDYFYWENQIEKIEAFYDLNAFRQFKTFNEEDKTEPQILKIGNYSPTNNFYGSPIYEGAILDIQTNSEISNFFNSNLHNNFAPGYFIFFRGPEPDEEQQDEITKALQEKYKGSENAGKPILMFLDSAQEQPQIEVIENSDIDKRFEQLSKEIENNIIISHGIPKVLITETAGKLGTSKEIIDASMLFKTNYIDPAQITLLKGFNMVMAINGLPEIKITNPNPSVLFFTIEELGKFLTETEIRDIFGYEEKEESEISLEDDKNENKEEEVEVKEEIEKDKLKKEKDDK